MSIAAMEIHFRYSFVRRNRRNTPCRVGSVSSVSASRTVGRELHLGRVIKMVQTASLHRHACVRVGVWQCSPTV